MLWKIKGSRHLARGGAPTLPALRVHHSLRPGRVRPLTGARSRAGTEWDDQVFTTYRSPQGFSLKVPMGWTRTERASSVLFEDKQLRIEVSIVNPRASHTAATARAARFAKRHRAVVIHSVRETKLPAGRSIQIRFTSAFKPGPAANKKICLESERYLITGFGRIAVLTFCAPAVVQAAGLWEPIADSFRW
jgi:hypothetical protein